MKEEMKTQYLVVLFFFGIFLLNYPVLAIYNIPSFIFGIPALFFWVFFIWAILVFTSFLIVRVCNKDKDGHA